MVISKPQVASQSGQVLMCVSIVGSGLLGSGLLGSGLGLVTAGLVGCCVTGCSARWTESCLLARSEWSLAHSGYASLPLLKNQRLPQPWAQNRLDQVAGLQENKTAERYDAPHFDEPPDQLGRAVHRPALG